MSNRTPEAIYHDLGSAFARAAAPGWVSGMITCRQVGKLAEYTAVAHMGDGTDTYPLWVSRTFGRYFDELRDLFAQPGEGTWFTATCHLNAEGRFSLDLDYDNEPQWQAPVSPGHYLEDLERYPRDLAVTPMWLQERLDEARRAS